MNHTTERFVGELPNGKSTKDVEAYVKAWRIMGHACERELPGHMLCGFDPNVALTGTTYRTNFALPIQVAEKLKDLNRLKWALVNF